jgi:ABC-2 type transporter
MLPLPSVRRPILCIEHQSSENFVSGYLISCLTASVQVASVLVGPLIVPMLLLGGLFLKNDSVPAYLKWSSYLSWFKFSNEMLSINQWSGITFNDTSAVHIQCPNGKCTGEWVLEFYAFNPVIHLHKLRIQLDS